MWYRNLHIHDAYKYTCTYNRSVMLPVVKFSRNGPSAVPAPPASVPPSLVGIPAEFNHWDQLNINTRVQSSTIYFWAI